MDYSEYRENEKLSFLHTIRATDPDEFRASIHPYLLYILDREATHRIAAVYHHQAPLRPEKEWQVRLSGEDMTELDAKRVRLVAIHEDLKTWILASTGVDELVALVHQMYDDATWA